MEHSEQHSELVFETVATHKVTGKETKAELFMVVQAGQNPFFVSNNESIIREALASDAFNPLSPNNGKAGRLLMMIGAFGFKSFEE